jgi:hypothetical protein
MEETSPANDFDGPWKEALDHYFEAFLAFFFPAAHAEIDWSRGYESLDTEFRAVVREAETGRRSVDKLVKVWRTSGREEWVLVHVEVQSQHEPNFGERMYVYHYRIFDRYQRVVSSMAVLGDANPRWRPASFGYNLWGCELAFRFPTAKLLDLAADEARLERDSNPFAAVVLAHVKAQETQHNPEQRRAWKLRLIKSLLSRGLTRTDIESLFRLIDWFLHMPPAENRKILDELRESDQEGTMRHMTGFEQLWLEEGAAKGRAAVEEAIDVMLRMKFGPAAQDLIPEIRRLADLDQLRAALRSIESAATVDDVRRALPQNGN